MMDGLLASSMNLYCLAELHQPEWDIKGLAGIMQGQALGKDKCFIAKPS